MAQNSYSYQPLNALVARARAGRPTLRGFTGGLALLAVLLALSAVLLIDDVKQRSKQSVASALASLSELSNSASASVSGSLSPSSRCPSTCSPDYYASPGMIRWGTSENDTRWSVFSLPSDGCMVDEPTLRTKQMVADPERWMADPEERYMAPDFMSYLVAPAPERGTEGEDELEEARLPDRLREIRNRQVLFIGSSHDRNNVEFFCQHVYKGKYTSWGAHIGGSCYVPAFNFTIVHWFLFGMVDEEYDWYHQEEGSAVTFERRISELMVQQAEERNLTVEPDLIILTSLFWDEQFMDNVYTKHDIPYPHDNGFLYNDVKWHSHRLMELIQFVRGMFGEHAPLMYRSRQLRMSDYRRGVLKIFQLDQGNKDTARRMGVRIWPWAELLEGYTAYYDKDQHFPSGASTWLFGDMTMFYLWQAVRGCWRCQPTTTPAC